MLNGPRPIIEDRKLLEDTRMETFQEVLRTPIRSIQRKPANGHFNVMDELGEESGLAVSGWGVNDAPLPAHAGV